MGSRSLDWVNDEVSYCTDGFRFNHQYHGGESFFVPPWVVFPHSGSGGAWVWCGTIPKSKGSEELI